MSTPDDKINTAPQKTSASVSSLASSSTSPAQKKWSNKRQWIVAMMIVAVLLFMSAMLLSSFFSDESTPTVIKWQEDVELKSGEVIRVNRTAKAKSFGEWGGPGGWENEGMTLQIATPDKADNPPLWDAKFVPVVFDRDAKTNEWFIVATFYSCESWYDLGRPKLPYTEYRLKNGAWQQVLLSPSSIGLKGNMVVDISSGGEPPVIDIATKRQRMATAGSVKKFNSVISEWFTTCVTIEQDKHGIYNRSDKNAK
jgi:hypothetical protein